jgi:hypothetical protein
LTAKTTETRYRDPLRTLEAQRFPSGKPGDKELEATAVKRKSHKVFDSKGERD